MSNNLRQVSFNVPSVDQSYIAARKDKLQNLDNFASGSIAESH
jgi:hypothetical protein